MEIRFEETKTLKEKPDVSKIGFGTHFTDYMFEMDYNPTDGWHDPRIVPYRDILVSPANTTLHYGQAIFDGLKAYKHGNKPVIFRASTHLQRVNVSAKILDIPEVPFDVMLAGLKKLIYIEKDWIPAKGKVCIFARSFLRQIPIWA